MDGIRRSSPHRSSNSRGRNVWLRRCRPGAVMEIEMRRLVPGLILSVAVAASAQAQTTLLNVSYDPTRELYRTYNAEFAKFWKEKTGESVSVQQSHAGSGGQARAV